MKDGIHVAMVVKAGKNWLGTELLPRVEELRQVKGFDWLDKGDDDLLGGEITVKGQTTKAGALEALEDMGLEVDKKAKVEKITVDGEPAIRFVSEGALARDATVGDLIDHLEKEMDVERTKDGALVHGQVDYDAYREHRLPMAYAIAAAKLHGGTGQLTFLGESDGELVATFVDTDGEKITIREVDPQNLTEDDWKERLGEDYDR